MLPRPSDKPRPATTLREKNVKYVERVLLKALEDKPDLTYQQFKQALAQKFREPTLCTYLMMIFLRWDREAEAKGTEPRPMPFSIPDEMRDKIRY